jgi:hypothetical protein
MGVGLADHRAKQQEAGSVPVTNPPPGWQAGAPVPDSPYPPSAAPQAPAKQKNTLGLIALIVGIIGFVFACIPGALIVGWVLLPIAFILGIVGLFASGKAKSTSIAAVIVSVVGTVVGVGVFVVVVGDAFGNAFRKSDLSPSAPTAINGGGGAPQPSTKGSPSSQGSRDNPLPIGEEDVPSSVELRWRPGEHQAALT